MCRDLLCHPNCGISVDPRQPFLRDWVWKDVFLDADALKVIFPVWVGGMPLDWGPPALRALLLSE